MRNRMMLIAVMLTATAAWAWGQNRSEGVTLSVVPVGSGTYGETIVSVEHKDGRIEVTKRSNYMPSSVPAIVCAPQPCDWMIRKVWREVYEAKDGKIVLSKKIEGRVLPAQDEKIEWPK